jgi:hypothetical protein
MRCHKGGPSGWLLAAHVLAAISTEGILAGTNVLLPATIIGDGRQLVA